MDEHVESSKNNRKNKPTFNRYDTNTKSWLGNMERRSTKLNKFKMQTAFAKTESLLRVQKIPIFTCVLFMVSYLPTYERFWRSESSVLGRSHDLIILAVDT